ncbi:MAG: ABC-F family ATP-binding cassette domain-containing protein [Oscillospiraceae bacterium]|nr:ABC-F family ATP-binding cassette domain-containing protein [Oscillospiraceae bacterium]
MIVISIQNIKKAFVEGVNVLDGITFNLNEGERVGLLGKNGAGKTTLLKLICGEISEDEGSIMVHPSKSIGLISQIPVFPTHYTADDVLRTAFTNLTSIKAQMEKLEEKMLHDSNAETLKAYDALAFEYERSGGYTIEIELNRVVNGLRIPQEQREQLFDSLSGGEKTRINLARLILENTEILLLDEPTNHLDMRGTEWLEEFLSKFKGTVLVVSHDRYFLDKTINRAIEIADGKAAFYSGNYSFYVEERKRRFDEQLSRYEREQAEAKRLRDAAARLHSWGTGNEMLMKKSRSILKRAERAITTEKPNKDKSLQVKFGEKEFQADTVLTIRDLSKSYNERKLFEIQDLEVKGNQRIAIIGDNGTGKTTLVKLIMGLEPPDNGSTKLGPSVKAAYLPQIINFENPRRSIVDTMVYGLDISPQMARNRLGAFNFSGSDVYKSVGDLSGGEKSRLRLCMLMQNEINLLILDEPTNHLDLASREWIEEAVDNYGETLIFISHDRYFIDKFATRIWDLNDGVFTDFIGTFSDYYEKKVANNQFENESTAKRNNKKGQSKGNGLLSSSTAASKSQRKKPSDIQKEIRRLEREIDALENKIIDIASSKEEFSTNYEKLMELDGQEALLQEQLDELYMQWVELSEEIEIKT